MSITIILSVLGDYTYLWEPMCVKSRQRASIATPPKMEGAMFNASADAYVGGEVG